MDAKICGVKNSSTLRYLLTHKYPPKYIGFICNYPKSKRHLTYVKLKKLMELKKTKGVNYVSVLVDPSDIILQKIKKLNFDYLQLYDVSPKQTSNIKNNLKIKIITAITVKNIKDVEKYERYKNISDIILFDSKGYEKSLSFNHRLLGNVSNKIKRMLAGNIKYNDKLAKFKKITDIIDISGSLETNSEKDISKINYFLKSISKIK